MTATVTARRRTTPEKFLVMEDAAGYELVDGELKERTVSVLASATAVEIASLLQTYARSGERGVVLGSDIGLQIFRGRPGRIPRPDVAFVAANKVTQEVWKGGFLRVPPDLIVEVISPGDTAAEMQRKVDEYLSAGVRLVWVVYPDTKRIVIFRADGTTAIMGPGGSLDGEGVLPGFSAPVVDLFPETLPAERS
jgi:Uma2 family endonuclease